MPLIKGTSQKSFEKNLKTEMEHGHSQKQSLAIAYSMKRKAEAAKHKAMGGEMDDSCPNCGYAHGGDIKETGNKRFGSGYSGAGHQMDYTRGVHKEYSDLSSEKGMSYAGKRAREGREIGSANLHERKLDELKSMPNPKLKGLAEGGEVEEMASGYEDMPENDVKHNEMAMHEDDKDLNQHHVMVMDSGEDDMVDRIMHKRSKTFEGEARLSQGGQVANNAHPFEADFEDPNEFDDLVLRDDNEHADFNYTGANSGDEIGDEREDEDRHDIVSRIMRSRKKKDRMPSPA